MLNIVQFELDGSLLMIKTTAGFGESVTKIFSVIGLYKNFYMWFIDRFHILPRKRIYYKLNNGTKFILETNTLDCQFINEMFIDHQYTRLSGFEISPTDVVIDFGAHKGIFTVFAAQQTYSGRVISYEPSPNTYNFLLENIKLNNLKNVTAINSAVGLSDGKKSFYVGEDPGCHMVVSEHPPKNVDANDVISVDESCFDRIIEELDRVDFVKMDVEGVEFEILVNCSKSSLNKIKRIALEYHPESGSVDSLVEHLEKVGFKTSLWKERRLLYAWRELTQAASHQD
ncbi:MAG: hypothetical protein C6Y22_10875 [Hapalosiphonaceae cyanobacterium JJU2]|nr:MAG: hypothetical protein C6Y22_10875 [Hapalosiphonaceae cyanobacterium JJU2]